MPEKPFEKPKTSTESKLDQLPAKPANKITLRFRTPNQKSLIIEIRSDSDCSILRDRLDSEGYPNKSYELAQAYPREKIDLSQGKTLEEANIKNHDMFHVQLRI